MEKLIELLDIYLKDKREYSTYDFDIIKIRHYYKISGLYEHLDEVESQALIISKEFWFIKWLVENDNIDTESYCRITSIERKWEKDVYRDEVDSLLMLLAIQDEPINFLISILK